MLPSQVERAYKGTDRPTEIMAESGNQGPGKARV